MEVKMDERGELVQRAKLAEQAERYDDMASCMKKVCDRCCLGTGAGLAQPTRSI